MADPALELIGCSYRYDGRVPALDRLDCAIERGSWTALVGQNGSGKTTMARLCNGLLRPQSGQVRVMGRDTRDRSVGELARQVGYLFQNPDDQLFAPTVREEIAFGLGNLGFSRQEREARLGEALRAFDLEAHAEQPPAMLGFGLRRQVTLASLFALHPPVLILDEPTTGLDWGRTRALLERLERLHIAGHTIVLITHQMRLVAEWAERVIVLHRGHIMADGTPRSVFAQADVMDRASLSPPPIGELSHRLRSFGIPADCVTLEHFVDAYERLVHGGGNCSS